jgi:MarR family transcriptional regulator, transcriptional regulator for hemolysin
VTLNKLRNLGFLLYELAHRYVRRFEFHARDMSLTLLQCKVLAYLASCEGISQSKLAEMIDVEPMTMVRMLDRMETEELLQRRPDPADRRARCLYLTARAGPMLKKIDRLAEKTRAECLAGIGNADRDRLVSMIERMYDNFGALASQSVVPSKTTPRQKVIRRKSRASTQSSHHSVK